MLDQPTPQLAILHTVARKLSSSVQLQQVLELTLSQVAELLGLESGWIFLLDEQAQAYLAAAQNLPEGLREEPERMSGRCYCLDMFHDDELQSAQNISIIACSRLYKLKPESAGGLRFHASIPLQAAGVKLGVMNVASRQKQALSQDELHTLYTIGDLLSLAIQRARYHQEHLHLSALSERYRLARELHDSLGQGLAALILRLETLDALIDLETPHAQLKPRVREGVELARATLREARSSVQNLRSPDAEPHQLERSLGHLVQELLGAQKVTIDVMPGLRLSANLSHGLYRMLQELVTNVHKHAQADRVEIDLRADAQGLILSVRDNGRGFDPEAIAPGHFGLLGLRERAHLLQGELEIDSRSGAGTQICVRLPGHFLPGDPR